MQLVLKYTYLMDLKKLEARLEKLWQEYQNILDKPTWQNLNQARAILYLIGDVYLEKIAPGAIKRRLHQLEKPINILEFFTIIDSKSKELKELRKDQLFVTLENYYNIVKKYKNLHTGGKYYLDEEKFIKLYNKYNPTDNKMDYMGKFDKK